MASTCEGKSLYSSLDYCLGSQVLPGVRRKVYFVSIGDVTAWPTLPAAATSKPEELVTYKGDLTLASEATFHRVDLITDKGQITWETQGEEPCVTVLNKLECTHPNLDEKAAAFGSQAQRDRLLFLVQQNDGKWRLLGASLQQGCVTKISGGTGEGLTGTDGGLKLSIEATESVIAPFFTGTVTTDDGELDCSNGAA